MKKLLIAIFSICILTVGFACGAAAEEKAAEKAPDAKAIYEELAASTAGLKSYKLEFEYTEPKRKGFKGSYFKCTFWYMGRDFLRLEVLEGEKKGAKVAYNAKRNAKKVYAKKGMLPLSFSKDDKKFTSFFKSDWLSDVEEISGWLEGAEYALDGKEEVMDRQADKIIITLKDQDFDRVLLWIDEKDKVLLQYEYYKGDVLDARKTWYNINLKPGFKAKQFKP